MKYWAIHIKLLLVKMQKRGVCIIMKVNRYYHTNLLFYDLRILKLEDLIILKTMMIMYNAKKTYNNAGIFKGNFRLYKINANKQDKQDFSHLKENYKAFLKNVNYVIIYHLGIYKNN